MPSNTKEKPGSRKSEDALTLELPKEELPIGLMPPSFEAEYVAGAVAPHFLASRFIGERPMLPMIDLALSKEKAVMPFMWGMLYEGWAPNPEAEGTSVFIQGYENRGAHNERKRIYVTATTPDLIATKYRDKLRRFFDELLADANAGKPLMKRFYEHYFDMYWDLHLGVRGDAIPAGVRKFGSSFNAVLGFGFPTTNEVHENYMRVRALREALKAWVDERVQDVIDGKVRDADRTFVHYWVKNGGLGEHFRRKDIVFECFHNFVAFSQLGNTTYNIMARLLADHGDAAVKSWFERTMANGPDADDGCAFTPLDRFAMELFRTISPNAGSLSSLPRQRALLGQAFSIVVTPHEATSKDPRHWTDPQAFNPDRYRTAPTTADNDEGRAQELGLARAPFPEKPFGARDGRDVAIANSAFGAVYPVIDGEAAPLCDAAGYAPFGFGYRRCAGEHLSIEFVKELLRAVHERGLSFTRLALEKPERLPVGPGTVIDDDIAFQRAQ